MWSRAPVPYPGGHLVIREARPAATASRSSAVPRVRKARPPGSSAELRTGASASSLTPISSDEQPGEQVAVHEGVALPNIGFTSTPGAA